MVASIGNSNEQIVDPRRGVNDLAALLSTSVGSRTVKCYTSFTLKDVLACLRGGVISAMFSCALFLAVARNFMLSVIMPSGAHHD